MTITAKYRGKCASCGEDIAVGEEIEWKKGEGSRHARCAAAPVAETSSAPSASLAFPPTPEQQVALDMFTTGRSLAIEAGAGTGKTSTLIMLAQSTPRRGQYVAFNRAIVQEAGEKMPANVKCSTAHSLAYKAIGHRYGARLRGSSRMKSIEIANRLGIDSLKTEAKTISRSFLAGLAMQSIVKFCQSADATPDRQHVPYVEGVDQIVDGHRSYVVNNEIRLYLRPFLAKIWADLMSPHGVLPFRHDHYLKAWQLDDPRIEADFILFDEAQDANPVMVAIVAAQKHAQLVWVGDSQQQIYTFTGAVNALSQVGADQRAFLTQSFRFGPAVAAVANGLLSRLNAELRLTGFEKIPSVVAEIEQPDVILTRTNAEAMRAVLTALAAEKRVALVGGTTEIVRFAEAARDLQTQGFTTHPELACFSSWAEVQAYVEEDEQGSDLRLMVTLIEDFGVQRILDSLEETTREEDADLVVSTAHKSKGREWDHVQLASDFPEDKITDEELRLLYVACTRAKLTLDLTAVAVLAAA